MKRPKGDRWAGPIGWQVHFVIFVAAFVIVVLRRPDSIFNPQFWAEDGTVWYAQAYNLGAIHSLVVPVVGYFQTISKLVAGLAQIFPLLWAPLIFNIVAIIFQILPASFMTSSRFSAAMPNLKTRILLSVLYLAIPNSREIHANLTNAQWHLALLAFMVIVAEPSSRMSWHFFDIGVVLLSGLSGPFSLFLTAIAALRWWLRRDKWLLVVLCLTGACALIQVASLAFYGGSRSHAPLGTAPELFIRILAGQIFLGALVGQRGYEWIISHSVLNSSFALIIALMGLIVMVNATAKAPLELRLFIFFSALIFTAALVFPQASNTSSQWQILSLPGVGGRYWFIPMLAFVLVLVWMLGGSHPLSLRVFAMLALAIMVIGIELDWHHPPYADFEFKKHVERFESLPQGADDTIPINPPGWSMTLVKH